MPTIKKPSNPTLWAKLKKQARASSQGSEPGRWSARKAAMVQREYEKRGGKWKTKS